MFWLYILIYFLGAVATGLLVYTFYVKEYKRENTALSFRYWIVNKYEQIFLSGLFWVIILPIMIIVYSINKIVKKINKHYNVKL